MVYLHVCPQHQASADTECLPREVTTSGMTERQPGNAHGHHRLASSQLTGALACLWEQLSSCLQVGSQRKNIREPEGVSSQTSSWLTPGANVTHRDWDQCSGSLRTTAQLYGLVQCG